MRLKLVQGVLVNYKIAGRDSYLDKMYSNSPVAALYFESWWAACLEMDYKGRRIECKTGQIRPTLGKKSGPIIALND